MKNKLVCFLYDQRIFSIIYVLAFAFVISFYQMTVKGAEVLYPILIALFFYVIYMCISLIHFLIHVHNLERLRNNVVKVSSQQKSDMAAYDALLSVHQCYNDQVAILNQKHKEEEHFISAFIHNLKTPVTVSSIILQRAKIGELNEKEALDGIESEMNRITSGLNTLLDLQRLTELQNDYEPKPIDLKEQLRKLINENKSLFIHNKVYPKVEVPDDSFMILTDSKWNRVLINQIISNAVKYSACDETKYLTFTINSQDDHTNLVIKDQGIGIPEYDIPRVFDAFFTGENGRAGYSASGIGLYLCKQICDRLGQQIKIENDQGCKVTISYLSKL